MHIFITEIQTPSFRLHSTSSSIICTVQVSILNIIKSSTEKKRHSSATWFVVQKIIIA